MPELQVVVGEWAIGADNQFMKSLGWKRQVVRRPEELIAQFVYRCSDAEEL
jgi:hypothetical protein